MSYSAAHSIRYRLMLAFLGLALLPVLLTGVAVGIHVYQDNLNNVLRLESELAQRVAVQLRHFFQGLEHNLREIERFRDFNSLPHPQRRKLLGELLSTVPDLRELTLFDAEGQQRVHVSRFGFTLDSELESSPHSEEFAEAKRQRQAYFGPIWFEQNSGEPLMRAAVPLSDLRSGEVYAVLSAQVRLKTIWDLIGGLKHPPGQVVYLLDSQQRVVAHPDPSVVLRGTYFNPAEDAMQTGLEGVSTVLVTQAVYVGSQRLRVVVEHATRYALRPTHYALAVIGLIVSLSIAAAALLMSLVNRQIILPLRALSASARRLQEGHLEHRAHVYYPDEIGELADTFNRMSSRLQDNLWHLKQEVAERKQAEQAVREQRLLLENVMDTIPQFVFWKDRDLRYLGCNRNFALIAGLDSPRQLVGKSDHDLPWQTEDTEFYRQVDQEVLESGQSRLNFEESIRHADGSLHVILTSKTPLRDDHGDIIGILGIFSDITERKQGEDSLRKLSQAVEQSPAAVVITDHAGVVEYVNPKFREISGYRSDEVVGHLADVFTSDPQHTHYRELHEALQRQAEWRGELRSQGKDGEYRWEYVWLSPIRDPAQGITHYLLSLEDISLRKAYEEKLLRQANYDDLTQLPNRVLAFDRLKQSLAQARHHRHRVGLIFIDLDQFKWVNDTLGHPVGDSLLQHAAKRLQACLREEDTAARLGGDEFTVVLPNIGDETDLETVAKNILHTFQEPFRINGQEIYMTPSMGLTLFPDDADNPQIMMQNADAAMYLAKENGRNNFQFFTQALNQRTQERLTIETELRHALERGELALHYQPLINLNSRSLCGVEALLRWNNPKLGQVSPDKFIPIAEDAGLINSIGDWVLEVACAQWQEWREQGFELNRIAVNISSRQFRHGGILSSVKRVLGRMEIPPHCLELEITEGLFMVDLPENDQALRELAELGLSLSVDDFGTGYSSLSYLKRFPVSTLKIDKSFVRDLPDDPDDAALAEAIISMGHSLGLEVIAEGVETLEQLEFLNQCGCDMVQGFYYSQPLNPDAMTQYLRNTRQRQSIF